MESDATCLQNFSSVDEKILGYGFNRDGFVFFRRNLNTASESRNTHAFILLYVLKERGKNIILCIYDYVPI